MIVKRTARAGPRDERTKATLFVEVGRWSDDELDTDWLSACAQHRNGLRMRVCMHEEGVAGVLRLAPNHCHCFACSGCLIEQRCIRQRQSGELGHHGLKVEQRLKPALADLGLIRRVRGVPRWIFKHVTHDHRGSCGAVVAHANEAGAHHVLVG